MEYCDTIQRTTLNVVFNACGCQHAFKADIKFAFAL